jgi:uncharacterized protein with NAD-binding domain and iron-sulfur cluster
MQTPVRFYITQNDDQPVVRTIPVARHPVPRVSQQAPVQASEKADRKQTPRKVARLVRRAVRRSDKSAQ